MTNLDKQLSIIITFVSILSIFCGIAFAQDEPFGVYTNDYTASGGGVAFNFYPSGYSDGFWWGYTTRHPWPHHEMLSGEHAAALAWSQSGSNQAIWLPDHFVVPTFPTNSIFQSVSYSSWNDSNNPIDSCDTAQSVIEDNDHNKICITIDYELVDLGEQDANGVGGSPIVFKDANGTVGYVYSDACGVLLLTYSIKNISDSNVTGIEFYQMHCGYPYGHDGHYSSYASENYLDPLSNYIPYNPVHKAPGSNYAGNFHYDISQWGYGDPNTYHVDWIGFSSRVKPDAFENNMFWGANGREPDRGTYVHIKNRSLDGNLYSSFDDDGDTIRDRIAGAMKWNLGNLEPNHTVKHTIAVMFGCKPIDYTPPGCSLIDIAPNPPDGIVNFLDFAVFANAWLTDLGGENYNDAADLVDDNNIDIHDLKEFCDCWLWPYANNEIDGQGEGESMEMQLEQEFWSTLSEVEGSESLTMEESQEDDQQSMMAGEGETASIYLICDVNEPNSGDEVTVQVYSDVPLLCMGLAISVTGDANITDAMSTADCNQFGWDPSWPSDPFFEENGWLYIGGVAWPEETNGVIGYIKFRYNSGQINVSIAEDCFAADVNWEPVLFSGEALTFGADPNES